MIDIFTYFVYVSLLFLTMFFVLLRFRIYNARLLLLLPVYKGNYSIFFSQPNKLEANHLVAILLISFIVGFRYDVGVDWKGYKDIFEFFKNNGFFAPQYQYMEWGYLSTNKIIASIGGSYELLFFTVAFLSWYLIFKSVPIILLPLVVYFLFVDEFFFWSMNGVRQFVSIAAFMYAIRFIFSKQITIFAALIVFGSIFHMSIIFMAPLYFVPFQKLYNQKFWIVSFILSFLFSKTPILIDKMQSAYMKFIQLIPYLSNYARYFNSDKYEAQELVVGLGYAFRLLISVMILILSKSAIRKFPQAKIYFIIYFLGAIIFNLFFSYQIVARLNNYLLVCRSVVLAIIVYHLWGIKNTRMVSIGIIVLYFLIFLAQIHNSSNMCSPYTFSF